MDLAMLPSMSSIRGSGCESFRVTAFRHQKSTLKTITHSSPRLGVLVQPMACPKVPLLPFPEPSALLPIFCSEHQLMRTQSNGLGMPDIDVVLEERNAAGLLTPGSDDVQMSIQKSPQSVSLLSCQTHVVYSIHTRGVTHMRELIFLKMNHITP